MDVGVAFKNRSRQFCVLQLMPNPFFAAGGSASGLVLVTRALQQSLKTRFSLAPLLLMIVSRINIFASGKMMLGNTLSFTLLKFFDWNPLFHLIDQMRGALFINYMPRNSSISYALWVSTALVAIGLMGEFFSRRNAPKY